MNNDFKKSSYILTILFFLIGIAALVCVSASKYFQFDELVVTVAQIVSLLAFFVMFINSVYAKSKYNSACIRFADYILTNRRKEAERKTLDAERMKEMQNIREAAEHERVKAVEAALQQKRSEEAQTAARPQTPYQQPVPMPQTVPMQQRVPAPQPMPQAVPVQREADLRPNEEMLYNEYGEPVMMRRRVRKTPSSPDGELLYDSNGNPVIRRNQGLWEPLEQRHEFVFKFETAPGMTMSRQSRQSDNEEQDGGQ